MYELWIDSKLVESFFDRNSALVAARQYELAGKTWAIICR